VCVCVYCSRNYQLSQLLPTASDEALDLLTRLLQFTADKRHSAHSAIHHPFVKRFHDARSQPVLDCDVVLHLDDNTQLPADRYRDRLYSAIAGKRSRMRRIREKREKGEGATHPPAEATPSSERAKSADSDVTPKATTSNKVFASPVIAKPRPFSSPTHQKPRPPASLHHSCVQTPDLTLTSARIIPSSRPDSSRGGTRGVARGAPSRVAMGTYTQTHGTISKSNLKRLLAGGGAYHHRN
jgi:serine/threonine protein kinase